MMWGWGNGRLLSLAGWPPSSLLLAAPPFTVRLRRSVEGLPILQVNFALVLFTEAAAVILPPNMEDPTTGKTIPFYQDPPSQPGLHRDAFATHSRQLLGKMLAAGLSLSDTLSSCAPKRVQQQMAAAKVAAAAAKVAAAAAEHAARLEELGMEEVTAIRAERPLSKRRKGSTTMEYLVEWAGYKPEWEAKYRQGRGEV